MASLRAIRSFVVRAFLGDSDGTGWTGHISDVETSERQPWTDPAEIADFVEARLAASEPMDTGPVLSTLGPAASLASEPMVVPTMSVVLSDLLGELGTRLPPPTPPLPAPNVTFEQVAEKLVGLGGIRGLDTSSPIGPQMLKGGRLDATVRFQLWGGTSSDVDDAVSALQSSMLDASDQLRSAGFLKTIAAETTVAEHVAAENAWRKSASYDVLYEYHYRDSDDAHSIIARIPVGTDLEWTDGVVRESETITDAMVRWDREGAAGLTVRGPTTVGGIAALAFRPTPPSGTVTLRRTSDLIAGPAVLHLDLATFLASITDVGSAEANAEVTLPLPAFLDAVPSSGASIELGDWDLDATTDDYEARALPFAAPLALPSSRDVFEIHYSDQTGLDTDAVLYLRANAT